jgi:hypothetical protein
VQAAGLAAGGVGFHERDRVQKGIDMSRTTRRGVRPSPAIVVAVVALIAALAGTAVAANPTATSSAINKKKVKKIATKQINKLAPDLSVAEADNARNLGGDPASAYLKENGVRYAKVNADGTVVASESKGITQANVSKDGTGDYCFNGLNPAPKGVSATLDWVADDGMQTFARLPANVAGHCNGQQLNVATYNDETGAQQDAPIYVVVF